MDRLAIIGDTDSVLAFQAVGMDSYMVTADNAEDVLRKAYKSKKYAIIFLAETLAEHTSEYLAETAKNPLPAITVIPMAHEKLNIGLERMKNIGIRATGTDIVGKQTRD